MGTLRDTQKQMTRELLLNSALDVMTEAGYAATTVGMIAARAGATRATFYLHFASKLELVGSFVDLTDRVLTRADDPPIPEMVASGDRESIRRYLVRKFDQWAEIKPYIQISMQAAAVEPEVRSIIDTWYDKAIGSMTQGLDAADRFAPEVRRARCSLAFGQLVFVSERWFLLGWNGVPREVMLEQMTGSWVSLLCDRD